MKKISLLLLFTITFACSRPWGTGVSESETGNWQSISSSDDSKPVARHEAAFARVGDQFYLLGGRGIRPVSIYDAKSNKWTTGSPPPIELHHFQPVVYSGKIYIVGAFTGAWPRETPVANIMIYDPLTDRWETGAAIPTDRLRGAAGATLYEGKIYLSCGLKNGHIGDHKNWLDSYDLTTGRWTKLPDAPRSRDHFNAIAANNKLYLAAGRNTETDDNPFGRTITEVDVFDFKSQSWETLAEPLPSARAGNAAVRYGDEILIIGGESSSQESAHAEVEALSIKSHTWRKLATMLEGRHGTGAILYNDKIFLASGCGKRGGEPELTTMECLSH